MKRREIGRATLICGDAYDVLPQIEMSIDPRETACVTDPPYEFDASGGGKMRAARPYLDLIERAGLCDGFDDALLTPQLFGAVAVFCHENQLAALKGALDRRYGRVSVCGWLKSNPPPWRNKSYLADVEFWLHAWMAGHHPCGEHHQLSRIFTGKTGKSVYDHPTVKPLDLMRRVIANVGAPVIVDPFMGTGTTGVAAIEAGRRFVGIERDPGFFEIAVGRLAEAQTRPATG